MSDDRYRLITHPDPGWVILPAYACRTLARAQEIISRVPLDEAGTPVKIADSRSGEILLSRPGTVGYDASNICSGRSSTWARHLGLGQFGPMSPIVLLMKSGKGQFRPTIKNEDLAEAPRWLHAVIQHPADFFLAWETNHPRRGLTPITALHRPVQGSPTTVDFFTGISVRGVLYARGYAYNPESGQPASAVVRIVLITAEVNWRRSPVCHLRFERHVLTAPIAEDGTFDEPPPELIEPYWFRLIEQARNGFVERCAIEQPDCTWKRRFLLEQIDKEDADAERNGTGFRGAVAKMALDEALALVDEPWMLGVVADVHARKFVTTPQQTYAEAVEAMLASYTCDEHRRLQLLKMKDDYLVPASDGWERPFAEAFQH